MTGSLQRFVDAHPRFRAIMIGALPLTIGVIDVPRIGATRDLLGDRWAGVLGWGLALGVVLLGLAGRTFRREPVRA